MEGADLAIADDIDEIAGARFYFNAAKTEFEYCDQPPGAQSTQTLKWPPTSEPYDKRPKSIK